MNSLREKHMNGSIPDMILKRAKKLLSKKDGWTQNTYARDEGGRKINFTAQSAQSFCSIGAIFRSGADLGYHITSLEVMVAQDRLAHFIPDGAITTFNDDPCQTLKEVLKVFQKAIERAP